MEHTTSVRILLIEEDPIWRSKLTSLAQEIEGCVVDAFSSFQEASTKITEREPDLIVLAQGGNRNQGIRRFNQIIAECPGAGIIVSLSDMDPELAQVFLSAGAWNCLVKTEDQYGRHLLEIVKYSVRRILEQKLRSAETSDGDRFPTDSRHFIHGDSSADKSNDISDRAFETGERVLHYRIAGSLGEGGMGQVYKALDDKLGRTVAIKVLPPSAMNSKSARKRLQQEARAASALNHPNIVTIFAIEQFQGSDFIAMEYVDGESLRDILNRGQLDTEKLLSVGIQIADALSVAHPAGLIHRDIKPANIMITRSGTIKLLDFGLSKRVVASDVGNDITGVGVVVGTVAYMSPEQTKGVELDARTDIFSLGTVLYQAAAGRLPFRGESALAIMHHIATAEPPDPCEFNPVLPPQIGRIILRALSKKRELRFQSAAEMAEQMRSLQNSVSPAYHKQQIFEANVSARKKRLFSIAVMPLNDETPDADMEYLSRGITENLINTLSLVPNLRVVPRSTVFRFAGKDYDANEVARNLNVEAILTGRITHHSGTFNIQAELTDVQKNSQVWGEQFNRKSSDIFSVQEELAAEIANRLRLKLSGKSKKQLSRRFTQNVDAYHCYLKGRHQLTKRTRESFLKAAEYFRKAIAMDDTYSIAYSGVADSLNLSVSYAYEKPKALLPRALEASTRALQLDPLLGEAHASQGYSHLLNRNYASSEQAFGRAVKHSAGYSTSYVWLGLLLTLTGRLDEAFSRLTKSLELEPLSVIANLNLGILFFAQKDYSKAIDQFLFTLATEEAHAATQFFLGLAYETYGAFPQAVQILQKCVASTPDARYIAALAHAHASSGNRDQAAAGLEELKKQERESYVSPTDFAVIHLGLEQPDQAMEYLRKAREDLSSWWIFLNIDPRFDPIRNTAHFQSLVNAS